LDWSPPRQFVDTQLSGPYKTWHHTHTFEPCAGGTLMKDIVRFQLRFGLLGRILNFIWVKGDVQRIFAHRKKVVSEIFKKPISSL
jgi:ligand-binding SRPBCC domain-containing protein